MNTDDYLQQVDAALDGIGGSDRRRVLRTLRDEFDQAGRMGGTPAIQRLIADLGDPAQVAESFGDALTKDPHNGGFLRCSGYGARGPDGESCDLWRAGGAPALPPKAFGLGKSLNFGAIAAAVGLINPDDDDERAWGAAGTGGALALVGLSASAAAAQLVVVGATWARLPASVPTHWGLSGAPDREVATSWVITSTLALALVCAARAGFAAAKNRGAPRRAVQTCVYCGLLAWASTVVMVASILMPSAGLLVGLFGMTLVFFLLVIVPALVLRRGSHRLAGKK